ncbi:MAG: hypothetical protein R2941_11295 [Desulfobacterales bacterium]
MNLNLKTALDSVNLLSTLEKIKLMQKITQHIESELETKQPKSGNFLYPFQRTLKNVQNFRNDADSVLASVKNLLENGNVAEARKMLSLLSPGSSGRADYWHKVLAAPNVMSGKKATGGNVKEDILWIQNNADSYKGKWVALKNGVLLGSHEKRAELHSILKQSGQLADAMFFYIEN